MTRRIFSRICPPSSSAACSPPRRSGRTRLARQTITGYSGWQGKKLRMGISGNMEYSVYLELGHEGRFAILWATVQANEQKIMDDLRKVVR